MDINKFDKILKEHYIKPLEVNFREMYRKKFNEEPPEDTGLMMDRFIKSGEEDISNITKIIKLGSL